MFFFTMLWSFEAMMHIVDSMIAEDVDNFFQHPVSDEDAPGYSEIVLNPMDYNTLRYCHVTHTISLLWLGGWS